MDRRVAFQRALFPTAPRNDRGPATLARVLRDLGRRRCTMGQPQMGGGAVNEPHPRSQHFGERKII